MPRVLSVIGLVHSQNCADELQAIMSTMAGVRLEIQQKTASRKAGLANRVVFVECRDGAAEDRQILRQLVVPDGPPVIAVIEQPSAAEVRDMMHLGVTDVVSRPVVAQDLMQALDFARRRLQALPQSRGRVLSFIGSCGGAGSTTLALQAALELVGRDKRRETKVCFLDLDLQFGSAALALDLVGSTGMAQILTGTSRFDDEFFSSAMVRHESGLEMLSAPGEIVPFEALPVETVEQILSVAQETYDYVVVDLPHAWTRWTPSVLAASSVLTLVLEPTVVGIKRARNHLKLIAEENLGAIPVIVAANRIDRSAFSGWRARIRAAADALEHEVAVTIRRDDKTATAARESGRPLRSIRPNSVIEKDVRALVDQALAFTAPALPHLTSPPTASGAGVSFRPMLALMGAGGSR